MITQLETDGAGFESPFEITSGNSAGKSWITVFIAENGGKKSFLLRCLAEAGLGNLRVPTGRKGIKLEKLTVIPDRVIAISGTPLDRFPRAGTRDLRSRKRSSTYNSESFVYLGQRAMNGMSGVPQSERSLVGSLFTNRNLLKKRENLLRTVFDSLGLEPVIQVYLRAVSGNDESRRSSRAAFDKLVADTNLQEKASLGLGGIKTLKGYEELYNRVWEEAVNISPNTPAFVITTDRVRFRQRSNLKSCELLMRIGAVEIIKTRFRRSEEHGGALLFGEELSSGQWNWLSSFGGLAVELRENSLILVDEPENSLHPNWQRSYMPELYSCLEGFNNCQVIVATHSPLIASGVSPEWGEVRTLKKNFENKDEGETQSVILPSVYGWSATDVYDELFKMASTRAPGFVSTANKALESIAGGKVNATDAVQWSAELANSVEKLPETDPLRLVYLDIISTLKTKVRSRSGGKRA